MTKEAIIAKFVKLSNPKKVEVLLDALDYMQQYNGRSVRTCICLAMGYRMNIDDDGNEVWEKTKSK